MAMEKSTTGQLPSSETEGSAKSGSGRSKLVAILLLHLWATTSFSAATKQSSNTNLNNQFVELLLRRTQRGGAPTSPNNVDSEDKYPDRHIFKLLAPSVAEGAWARKVPASHAAAASAAAAAAAAIRLSRRQSEQMPNGRVRPVDPPEPDCKTLRAMWRTMRRMNRQSEMNNDIPQLPNFLAGNHANNPFTVSVVPGRFGGSGKLSKSSRRRVMVKNPTYGGGGDFFTDAIIIDPENPYSKFGGGRRGKVYLKPGFGFESGHPVIITDSGAGFDLSGFGAFPEEVSGTYGSKYRGRKPDYVVHHVPLRNPPPPGEFLDNPLSTPSLGGDFGTVVNSPEERALFKSGKLDSRNFGTKIPGSFGSRATMSGRGDSNTGRNEGGNSGGGKMILPGDGIGVFGKFGSVDEGHAFGHDTEHGFMKSGGGERGRKDPFFGSMVGKQHMDQNPGPFVMGSTRYSRGGKDESCARLKFKRCKSDPDCDCSGSRLHCSFTSLPSPGSVRYGKCVPFASQSKKVYSDDWGRWYGAPLETSQLGMSNLGPRLRRTDPSTAILSNYDPLTSPEDDAESPEIASEPRDSNSGENYEQAKIKFMTARLQDLTQRVQELPNEFWQTANNNDEDNNQNLDSRFL